MKGLSGNLGASELQRYARLLEDVIKPYIGKEILEDEMDAILGKEWIMFSEELKSINKSIDLVLEASDQQLGSMDTSSQLIIKSNEIKVGLEEIDKFTKELLLNESKSAIQILLKTLKTYNYEAINKALDGQDEELLKKCCSDRWEQIKEYIKEFEYDKAKEEILKGVNDEE